jgi:predicted nucleic acid-binding Zn ribbon protein
MFKVCPYCAQTINQTAVVCPLCGRDTRQRRSRAKLIAFTILCLLLALLVFNWLVNDYTGLFVRLYR